MFLVFVLWSRALQNVVVGAVWNSGKVAWPPLASRIMRRAILVHALHPDPDPNPLPYQLELVRLNSG